MHQKIKKKLNANVPPHAFLKLPVSDVFYGDADATEPDGHGFDRLSPETSEAWNHECTMNMNEENVNE